MNKQISNLEEKRRESMWQLEREVENTMSDETFWELAGKMRVSVEQAKKHFGEGSMIENGIHNWFCDLYYQHDEKAVEIGLEFMIKYKSIVNRLSKDDIYDKIRDYDYFSDDGFHDFTDSLPLFNDREQIEELLNSEVGEYRVRHFEGLYYTECYVYSTLFNAVMGRIR